MKNQPNPTYSQLKKNYYRLIKKYHRDNTEGNQNQTLINQEITKVIIKAYHAIDKQLFEKTKQNPDFDTLEDQITMELFGKKYRQVKYWMYEKGNQKAKDKFFAKLFQKTGKPVKDPKAEQYYKNKFTSDNSNSSQKSSKQDKSSSSSDNSSSLMGLGIVGIIGLSCVFWLSSKRSYDVPPPKKPQQPSKYDPDTINQIFKNKINAKKQKADVIIKTIVKEHPPSIHWPQGEQPHIMKQLIQYSIAPDIHLYEVQSDCYLKQQKQNIVKNGYDITKALKLDRIKANTTMTLSLQAQRALHNIYIKVKDLMTQIQKNGKYTPPKVFLRFHGYIMFQIRQKPISLRNYKDTDYISLFDLYFDYYSPVFLKRDNFTQYLVCKDDPQYFGWVHLDNKKCNPVYAKITDKAVYFYPEKSPKMEDLYQKIWSSFYKQYQDRWREGGNTKARCGV